PTLGPSNDPLTSVYPESVLCPAPAPLSPGLSAGFASTCAGCHGPVGEGQGSFPSIRNVPTFDQFLSTVRLGKNQMPAFSEALVPTDRLMSDYGALHAQVQPMSAADPD